MKNIASLFMAAVTFASIQTAFAEALPAPANLSGYAKIGYDWVDVAPAEFDGYFSLEAGLRLSINDQFSLEAAVTGINDSTSDRVEDNVGSYQLTLNSLDVLVGGYFQHPIANGTKLYLRGGALFYSMEIEIEEGFYDLKPAGKDTADDRGFGLYAGVGAEFKLSGEWSGLAEFLYKTHPDFLSSSSKPFDVNSYGIAIGLSRRF